LIASSFDGFHDDVEAVVANLLAPVTSGVIS